MTFMWLLFACESTKNIGASPVEPTQQEPERVPPVLVVDEPSRGAFVVQDDIAVSGTVQQGSAPITRLTLNQSEITVSDGQFASTLTGEAGVHLLHFRLEADDRERSVDSIGVYKGPFHPLTEAVASGIRMQIGQELLDDGDPDLDDLATIAESILNETDLSPLLLGTSYSVSGFTIEPTSFAHGGMDVAIQCGETLNVSLEVADVELDFIVDTFVDLNGEATASKVILDLTLDFAVVDGDIEVIPVETLTSFVDVAVDIQYIPGLAENLLVSWAQESIENTLAQEAENIIGDLAASYLSSFIIDTELFAGVSIRATMSDLDVGSEGLRVIADGLFYGPVIKDFSVHVGSAKTAGEPPDWPLNPQKPFVAAASGDLANQLLFAAWATGYFDDIEINGILVQGLAGDAIPPPIGPIDLLRMNLALPPSIHQPTYDGLTADLAIAEWQMHFLREDGEEIDYRINLRSGVDVSVEDGRVRLHPDSRPAKMDLGVATLNGPENLDFGDLSALGRLMVPSFLGSIDGFLPSIDLPTIPLGLLDSGLEGEELVISDAELRLSAQSWVVLEAGLEQ